MRRFWKLASVQSLPNQRFAVTLDGKTLKTPNGSPVQLSSSPLATLVATEWQTFQPPFRSHSLPLSSMIFRAIDDFSSSLERKTTIERLLKYIKTDSVIYRMGEPEELVQLQNEYLNPMVNHLKQEYGYSLNVTDSLFAVQQPDGIIETMTRKLESLSSIQLSAFEKATMYSKSFFIPLALMDGVITVEQAMNASRVELIHQLKKWGTVPESHPLDEADLKRQLSAAACCRIANE